MTNIGPVLATMGRARRSLRQKVTWLGNGQRRRSSRRRRPRAEPNRRYPWISGRTGEEETEDVIERAKIDDRGFTSVSNVRLGFDALHRRGLDTAWPFDLDLVAHLSADQATGQRRFNRHQPLLHVGLIGADQSQALQAAIAPLE